MTSTVGARKLRSNHATTAGWNNTDGLITRNAQAQFALATGFSLGAGAIHGLHAAASPPAYVINEITVKDENGYKKDFLPGAQKAIDDNGGKYIAGGFNKTFSITGQPPADRVVILQFENMDKVKAWRDAARDAQEKIGSKYATFRTFAVEGVAQY
jgi:uncharacterized protein (DUF1330 family)